MPNKKLDCLMLHGWGFRYHVWEKFSYHLIGFNSLIAPCLYQFEGCRARGDVFRSIAVDLSNKIDKNCVVIAWSLGGLIAIHLSELSKKVKAIILIASTPCFVNKRLWQYSIPNKDLEMLQYELSHKPKLTVRKFIHLVAKGDKSVKTSARVLQQSSVSEKHMRILAVWLHSLREVDLRNQFSSLKIPVYVLLGRQDALIDCAVEQQLKQLNANIKSHVIDNCGHAPFISQAEQTQSLIKEFINAEFGE